jgi:hypothetical protein
MGLSHIASADQCIFCPRNYIFLVSVNGHVGPDVVLLRVLIEGSIINLMNYIRSRCLQ